MSVVIFKYIRDKEQIKANLRYITHRTGHEKQKKTRDIFTNLGQTDKKELYRHITHAGRGTVFYKFVISPDPRGEDSLKDLDLRHITRRMIRKMEKAVGRRLFFVAAVHNDHTDIRHVHGIFIVRGRLSREHFTALQEAARFASTREAILQRRARDLTRQSSRYQRLSRNRSLAIHGRGKGRVQQVTPGCRNFGFGQFSGIPGKRTNCPLCHAPLSLNNEPRLRLTGTGGRAS